MVNASVQVRYPGGVAETYDIGSAEAIIGTSSTATITLPVSRGLEPQHLLLIPGGRKGCWVSVAEGARTPVTFNGVVLDHGRVPWGSDLRLGTIEVRPFLAGSKPVGREAVVGGFVVVLLLALTMVVVLRSEASLQADSGRSRHYPELFSVDPACVATADFAKAGARAEAIGRAREDRYPYDPRDGVRAVIGYRRAAACYARAGRDSEARRADEAGERLANRVRTDYASARLTLASAIEAEQWDQAYHKARELRVLLSHIEGHEYVEWIDKTIGLADSRRRAQH